MIPYAIEVQDPDSPNSLEENVEPGEKECGEGRYLQRILHRSINNLHSATELQHRLHYQQLCHKLGPQRGEKDRLPRDVSLAKAWGKGCHK